MLLPLTLAVIAAVILALAGYLVAIAVALARARRNVAQLAAGLEAVAGHVEPLRERLDPVNFALAELLVSLSIVDRHLLGVARVLRG